MMCVPVRKKSSGNGFRNFDLILKLLAIFTNFKSTVELLYLGRLASSSCAEGWAKSAVVEQIFIIRFFLAHSGNG